MILSRVFGLLFPLALALSPIPLGAVQPWSLSLWSVVIAAAFAMAWFPALAGGRDFPASATLRWIALYLVFFLLSWYFSKVPARGAAEAYNLSVGLLVFAASLWHCRDRASARSLCLWLATAGAAYAMIGLLQYLGALPKSWWQKPHFISGPFVNHNHFAGLLELALPLSAALALYEKEVPKKALFAFFTMITALALVFTQSRGAWLSVSAAFLVMFVALLGLRRSRMAPAALILLVLGVAAAVALFGARPLGQRLDSIRQFDKENEVTDRFYIWQGGWNAAVERPWLGNGPGSFDPVFLRHRPAGFRGRAGHAHNDYLELFADCGVFALAAAAGLVVSILIAAIRVMRSSESRFKSMAAWAAMTGLLSLLLHGLVDFNFHIPSNWLWSCALAGMVVSMASRKPAARAEAIAAKVSVTALFPAVAAGALFFGVSDVSFQEGRLLLRKGLENPAHSAFSRATRLNPLSDEAFDGKGRSAPAKEASGDFERASILNPFEPYYFLHRAQAVAGTDGVGAAMPLYRAAVERDPNDAQLRYTCAASILRANRKHDAAVEREALELLASAVRLRPALAVAAYRTVHGYRSDPRMLEALYGLAPESLDSFLEFMKKSDRWALYRKYLLIRRGPGEAGVRELLEGTEWPREAATFTPAYFIDGPGKPFRREGQLYGNGQISREVAVPCERVQLTVRARGTRAYGHFPVLEIGWDGEVIDALTITEQTADHVTAFRTRPGTHRLTIAFVNDRATAAGQEPASDRNVWLDRVEVRAAC